MPQDPTQVRVGVTGSVLVAPLGTTVPITTAGAWTGWTELGLIAEDAPPEMAPSREVTDIRAWQRFFPVRTVKTAEGAEVTFTLIQKTGSTLKLAFGGGTVTNLGGGDYRYTPPAATFIDERMLGIEVIDGTIIDRYIARRAFVTTTGAFGFRKDAAIAFPLTVRVLEPTTGDRWEILSNDAAMAV